MDSVVAEIARYVAAGETASDEARATAHMSLLDALGVGLLALRYPECAKLLGPIVPGVITPNGARVPGTPHVLDPVKAAFDIGAMIRWLDYNDTWLAAEWGHPSDNLGGILAAADYASRARVADGQPPLLMRDALAAMVQAHEIQGVLALENSFNRAGMDHTLLVRVATAATTTKLLGGAEEGHRHGGDARLDRRRPAAALPSRAQHRLAQVVGGGRRHQPGRAPGAAGADWRDGLRDAAVHA